MSNEKSRRSVLAGTAATGALGLAGCLGDLMGGDESEGNEQLTFWHAMGGGSGDLLNDMVEGYEGADGQAEYQGSYEETLNSLFSSIEADEMPDVVMIDSLHNQQVLDTEATQPVSELLGDDFPTDDLVSAVQDFFVVDGQLNSMPFNNSNAILYYNKDAFEEAGLDPEQPPETLEDVRDYSEAIVDSGAANYGITWPNHVWFVETFYSLADELLLDEENGHAGSPTTIHTDTDFARDLWSWWQGMYEDDLFLNSGIEAWGEARSAFLTGEVAMKLDSTAAVEATLSGAQGDVEDNEEIDEEDVDTFELGTGYHPSPTEDRTGVVIGGASLWVSNQMSDEREEEVAGLLEELSSIENQIEWHKGSGYYPIRQEAISQLEDDGWFEDNPHYATAFDQLLESETTPATLRMLVGPAREVQLRVQERSQEIFSGDVSVEDGLASMKEDVEEELERYDRVSGQ